MLWKKTVRSWENGFIRISTKILGFHYKKSILLLMAFLIGCFNYAPTFFGTSVPEVTHVKENEDGTITLTVDAVCEMILCDDAVITHEITVRFAEDGSFQYLGNEILNDGIMQIPDYQYRTKE